MNFKDIVLSKRSQIQKTTYCIIPFKWTSRKGKTIVKDWRSVISGAGDGGGDRLQRSMKELLEVECLY